MNNDHLAPTSQTRKRHHFANRTSKKEDAQRKQSGGRLWQKEGESRIPIHFTPYSMSDSTSQPASPINPSQIPQHTKEESKRNRRKDDESGSCIIFTSTHPPEASSTPRNRSKSTSPKECRGAELLSKTEWKSETLLPYSPRPSSQSSPGSKKLLRLAIECFSLERPNRGAQKFVSECAKKKTIALLTSRNRSEIFQMRYEIYRLMEPYIGVINKIDKKLTAIFHLNSTAKVFMKVRQQLFQHPPLWGELKEAGTAMLSEEKDPSAPFSRKKKLRKFIKLMDAINEQSGRLKNLLSAALGGETNRKAVLSLLTQTEKRREAVLPLLNQRHFIRETQAVDLPIHRIAPKEILITINRGKLSTDPVGVAYSQVIVRNKVETIPKDFIVIEPREGETNGEWYGRLFRALNIKGYGPCAYSEEEIKAQVNYFFQFTEGCCPPEKSNDILQTKGELHSEKSENEEEKIEKGKTNDYMDSIYRSTQDIPLKGEEPESSGDESEIVDLLPESLQDPILIDPPFFDILQRLTSNASAVMFYATTALWPEIFGYERIPKVDHSKLMITEKPDFHLKGVPRRGAQPIGEVCIFDPHVATVKQRKVVDFILESQVMVKAKEKKDKSILTQVKSIIIPLGFMWLELSMKPMKESEFPTCIHLKLTDFSLEEKINPQHSKYRKLIHSAQKLIQLKIAHYEERTITLINGAEVDVGVKMRPQRRESDSSFSLTDLDGEGKEK